MLRGAEAGFLGEAHPAPTRSGGCPYRGSPRTAHTSRCAAPCAAQRTKLDAGDDHSPLGLIWGGERGSGAQPVRLSKAEERAEGQPINPFGVVREGC